MSRINSEFASMTLDQLPCGQCASISALHGEIELRKRIQSIGLRVGREILVVRRSRFGGPLQVRIGASDLIIRPQQAALVELK